MEWRKRIMTDGDTMKAEERVRTLATEARRIAIIGIFFFGVIVGPIALWRVAVARKRIRQTGAGESFLPHLKTSQQIAIAAIIVWAVGPVLKLSGVV
jgi:hypothetical protein